ncbi:methylesterase 1 [Cryptomeria japonica]|uniref:methylesterase 1 n=1 Tax=Cryptomeria japonica TaxID=3369 RepID=UPI0025AD6AD8|nr:methylesterase 1 [Cryptomeria japonica]
MACDSRSFHFVLVHGSCFGGWCWYKVADLLMKDGHTVSALDMTSQGIDPTDADHISTLEEYNKPLTDFFTGLPSNHKVILVGHSAGGFNLTYTMERFPHNIVVAVFVTALMTLSGLTAFDSLKGISSGLRNFGDLTYSFANGEENKPTSVKFGKQFSQEFLLQNTPSSDICLTHSLLKRSPYWEGVVSYTKENYGRVPRAYIVAKEDKLLPEEFQRKMIADNPPQMVYEIEGSDHSPFFCKPDQLAHILLQIANRCLCN